MTKKTLISRILPALFGAGFLCAAQAAVPTIDLGAANAFSGFFYGNVSNVADVEGRLAVGGDLTTSGFSVGYRTPYGVTAPSIVVGGTVALGDGTIYAAPLSKVNTNASIGPITEYEKNWNGFGVYGGGNTSKSYLTLNKVSNISSVVDFAATKTQLTQLSTTLNKQTAHGDVAKVGSNLYLTGDKVSGVQVFDIVGGDLSNLVLRDVKVGATVIINVTGADAVTFSGGQDGQLPAMRANVLFNLNNASTVNVNTFVWGSILANSATLLGTGHLEGNIIANAMTGKVEIGYEPFKGYIAAQVPEPETYAMLLAGLGLVGAIARRRKAA